MKSRLHRTARVIRLLARLEKVMDSTKKASVSEEADIRRVKQMIQAVRRVRSSHRLDERTDAVLEFLEKNLRELL